jgi:type III secretion protein J
VGLRLLTLALALALVGCNDVDVLQSVTEADAHRAVEALDRAGVAAVCEPRQNTASAKTWRVHVAPSQVARAVSALSALGLPRREQPGFAESWGERSLVMTHTEERARAAQATAGELARTLTSLDGVLEARVHLSPGSDPSLSTDAPRPATASVLVRHSTASPPVDEARVRALVAGAVESLTPSNVAVIFVRFTPPAPPAHHVARVGPLVVEAESVPWARAIFGVWMACVAALIAAVVKLRRRA